MSWSISPPVNNVPAEEAIIQIEAMTLPGAIKDYIFAGIAGIQAYHDDENAPVTVSGSGHLCTGKGSYDMTSASISVMKGVSETVEESQ